MNKSIQLKMNSAKKIIKTLSFSLSSLFITSVSFASDAGTGGTELDSTLGEIAGILSWLAFIIAVGKMIQIGIMFMLGAGKSKNDAKAALMPWLVGADVCALFATLGPWIIGLIMGGSSGGVFDI